MASRMSSSAFGIKMNIIDDLEKEFQKKLSAFTGEVKSKMQNTQKDLANHCFELALVFLSQVFPNLDDLESAKVESEGESLTINPNLDHLTYIMECHEKKLKEQETNLSSKLKNTYEELVDQIGKLEAKLEYFSGQLGCYVTNFAQKLETLDEQLKDQVSNFVNFSNFASKQEQVEDNVAELSSKLKSYGEEVKKFKSYGEEVKKLKIATESHGKTIAGMKKEQASFKNKLEQPKTDSQTYGASAAAATADPSGVTLSLSQRKAFKVQDIDCINDAKLVSNNLLVVAVSEKDSVKLFSTEGQLLDTLLFDAPPIHLTVIEVNTKSCWASVAVLFQGKDFIEFLEINQHSLSRKSSVITSDKNYTCLAVLDSRTLAALNYSFIDIIDHSGQVLRTVSGGNSIGCVNCIVTSENQGILSLGSKLFFETNLRQGTQSIQWSAPQLIDPICAASLLNGAYIVAEKNTGTLHLVYGKGSVEKILWRLPASSRQASLYIEPNVQSHFGRPMVKQDFLTCVSVTGNTCVAGSSHGSVFVFNIQSK